MIIGATSSIAHECARLFANQYQCFFTLIARNQSELDKNKSDLLIRSKNTTVETLALKSFNFRTLESLNSNLTKPYDIYILAHGVLIEQNNLTIKKLLDSNKVNINTYAHLIYMIYECMKKFNKGHLILFGSVAGDRGRQSNFWYGASKAYINAIFQGIEHDIAVHKRNLNVSIIKPGPTLTKMTMHLSNAHSFAKTPDVAREIVKQIINNKSMIYVPKKWKWIMRIIIHLPRFVFKKFRI